MEKEITEAIQAKADEISFSGVISLKVGNVSYQQASGFRDRANELPNTLETRFATASCTKGFTALAIAKLIDNGAFDLDTTARSLLGDRIKNLHPEITIRQLLSHTSGIGDYLDEDEAGDINEFFLSIPVHRLSSPFDFVPLLEKKNQKFPPGEKSSYSNSGYMLLSIIIELVATIPYQDFVEEHVFTKSGMRRSAFFRSDALPDNTALGYISKDNPLRTNIFNLPIRGGGDGGAYTTVADMERFWEVLKLFTILPQELTDKMTAAHSVVDNSKYGYGFWIDSDWNYISLIGCDAGVSFYSSTNRSNDDGFTVISNTSSGVWPIAKLIKSHLLESFENA